MQRILEAEIMDDALQVQAYAAADFSSSNQWYVENLIATFPDDLAEAIDVGCGPADVAIRLASAHPNVKICAVDGSAEMISRARAAVASAGLDERVRLVCGFVPGLDLPDHSFDAILSKDFLHHLPDPQVFWSEARRLARPGAAIYVMDLYRPESQAAARAIVEEVSGDEHPLLKEDFYNSLCAAFTPAEIAEQLAQAGLRLDVVPISNRHMIISGRL